MSIPNLAQIEKDENCIIVNIEDHTELTTIINGKIYNVEKLDEGSQEILDKINLRENSYSKAYEAYIFCKSNKEKLISSITQIKHTTVKTEIISNAEISIEQKFKEISGSVASLRLDSIISVACKSSRSQCLTYIKAGNVYINGRCCTENAKEIKNNDIITIRGFGKFLIETSEVTTKKGRFHIIVKQYV